MITSTGDMSGRRAGNVLLVCILFTIVFFLSLPLPLFAKVTGLCSNCHTMHNSQNGTPVTMPDTPSNTIGWGSDGKLSGGSADNTPSNNLLVTNCVGCHSSSTASTTITTGSSIVPIVYNTVPPTTPLAGGNFYWVTSDDTKGHNVYGIAGTDANLGTAPGRNPAGCDNSCHDTLAAPPSANNYYRGGCQGCHVFTYHHEDNGVYRFLKGHGYPQPWPDQIENSKDITTYTDYVVGVEDSDWEYTTDNAGDHNYYKGTADNYTSGGDSLTKKQTITSFCSGCHQNFHGTQTESGNGMGSGSPWIRHPTDILLPDTGEYGKYDPDVNANYSVEAPVAWINPEAPTRAEAVVMCLSCHRPHGSDQPDMLRWDYRNMVTGATGSTADTGCFTCHRDKDGT